MGRLKIELSNDQLEIAEAIQLDIDQFGSALVPFSLLNETFGHNPSGFSWLENENHWKRTHDRMLSLTTFIQSGTLSKDELPIRKLIRKVRRMTKNNINEEI